MPDASSVIQIFTILILLILSAFFSSALTAFSEINQGNIRTLEEEGNKRAGKVNRILNNQNKMINTILIGNTVVNIIVSVLAMLLAIDSDFSIGITAAIIILVILLFGEIIPKTWAKIHSESIALAYSSIISLLMSLLTPVVVITDFLSRIIMKLLHIDPDQKTKTMTESELKTYVDVSHEDGVIESEEREMIYNVFDFSAAVAKDIMIPRINMVSINVEDSYAKVLAVFRESMYTRLPVYQETKENIIGFVNVKDFILLPNQNNFSVKNVLRKAHYTYEFKKTADLMLEMREKSINVTFVLNEYGATVGMITLEDLLEEIVGDIRDEYDADEALNIIETGERTYMVKASMKLDDINDALDTELESEDYDSIGGIIIENLDRLPEDGEEVQLTNGIQLKVMGMSQNRILNVQMILPEPKEDDISEDKDKDSAILD